MKAWKNIIETTLALLLGSVACSAIFANFYPWGRTLFDAEFIFYLSVLVTVVSFVAVLLISFIVDLCANTRLSIIYVRNFSGNILLCFLWGLANLVLVFEIPNIKISSERHDFVFYIPLIVLLSEVSFVMIAIIVDKLIFVTRRNEQRDETRKLDIKVR